MLGIETSCDDTAAAVVSETILNKTTNDVVFAKNEILIMNLCFQVRSDGEILSQVVSSQVNCVIC